ncbi:MAG TPA: acetate--CoA ligase family protein, partial [Chloroflexota bacterium]|nr:acetate--CoA ligase family protein [Chloroflexota bacterium]
RCDTLEDLFAVTTLLSNQPLPAGNRVGVITNAGGLGILCADACEASGLTLPELSENTRSSLRSILPPEASVANPVDMLASGSPASYGQALKMVLDDPVIDAAIVLFIPPLVTHADDVAKELVAACTPAPSKPVLTCFVGTRGTPEALRGTIAIPSYTYPESAARALGHAARRSAWLRRPAGRIPQLAAIDAVGARALIDAALAREVTLWLRPAEVDQLLDDYGIPRPRSVLARSAGEAAAAFESLGGKPVAIKLVSDVVTHKSDVGGVRLGIDTAQGAAQAYDEIAAALRARGLDNAMNGVLVQPMVPDGVECLVGVVTDPTFGPLLAFGLGGVIAEALGDVQFRLHPLTDVDAEELVESAKVSILLHGYRGSPPSDLGALRDLLLRLSQLVEDVPEIVELDLNPVKVLPDGQGAVVIDARIRLARPNRPQAGERPH